MRELGSLFIVVVVLLSTAVQRCSAVDFDTLQPDTTTALNVDLDANTALQSALKTLKSDSFKKSILDLGARAQNQGAGFNGAVAESLKAIKSFNRLLREAPMMKELQKRLEQQQKTHFDGQKFLADLVHLCEWSGPLPRRPRYPLPSSCVELFHSWCLLDSHTQLGRFRNTVSANLCVCETLQQWLCHRSLFGLPCIAHRG